MKANKIHIERTDLGSHNTGLFTKDYKIGDTITWLGHDHVYGYMYGEEFICTKKHFDLKGDQPVYRKIGEVHLSKIRGGNDLYEIFDDRKFVQKIPSIIRKLFFKTYYNQGMVYLTEENDPCYCSSTVKWLENVCVETTSEKRADKLMFNLFNEKYPQYKPYIQLY